MLWGIFGDMIKQQCNQVFTLIDKEIVESQRNSETASKWHQKNIKKASKKDGKEAVKGRQNIIIIYRFQIGEIAKSNSTVVSKMIISQQYGNTKQPSDTNVEKSKRLRLSGAPKLKKEIIKLWYK